MKTCSSRYLVLLGVAMSAVGCAIPDWKVDGRITRYTAIEDHKFKPAELTVPANTPFWLAIDVYDSSSTVVISSDALGIGRQTIPAHVHASRWPESDPPVRTRLPVDALPPGRYEFTCECHGEPAVGFITAVPSEGP